MVKPRVRFALLAPLLFAACASSDDVTDDPGDPGGGGAIDPLARFTAVPAGTQVVNLPPSMSSADVVVMLELASDPITVASANAAVPMTAAQKQTTRTVLTQLQAPVVSGVAMVGATALGQYQNAYNGVKVRAARNQVATLAALPGVIAVHEMPLEFPENTHGVPLVGGPAVWDGVAGLHGEGIKVAVIDTGIDYTHADFGGPGTVAAYTDAHAAEASPADPTLFGPGAPRVKGGTDLVGDAYNGGNTPTPDANPLDCNGHGSHVAGTIGGDGVLADGTTYAGAYDATTISGNAWMVGPGVAPKADLYAVRVFGCTGGTNMTVDAIEWAVDNDMDVINMSLGSPYGTGTDVSATAASNAAAAGVIVVASAGNSGTNQYLTGSPASGNRTISVAAMDPITTVPGAHLVFGTGTTLDSIDANGATFSDGTTLPVKVLMAGGTISIGCNPAEYMVPGVAGALVITRRGTCARVARAIFGQQAGAAAVLMVNNAASLPPYEGPITQNPDTGELYTVTIPFLGVPSTALAAMQAADGSTVSLTNISFPGVGMASFTSGGPRSGDSWLKPDVTAPGVAIISAGNGTGNAGVSLSGTSMASPHTAGVAALVRQAHPTWNTEQWKAAIVNTTDRSLIPNFAVRYAGAGRIQALPAVQTTAVATGDTGTASLNFGYLEITSTADVVRTKTLHVRSRASVPLTFDLSVEAQAGAPHSVAFSAAQVVVAPNKTVNVTVTVTVPAATAGNGTAFTDVAGLVTLTPAAGDNNGVALHVPYYLVPQATAKVAATLPKNQLNSAGTGTSTITNPNGVVAGNADWYALGISEAAETVGQVDVKAVGAQSILGGGNNDIVVFELFTTKRWSNAAANEYDVLVDVNQDGVDDYDVVAYDFGILSGAGAANGQCAVAVINLLTGARNIQFLADAPLDSRTLGLPVRVSQLCVTGAPCLSAASPRLTYHVNTFGRDGATDTTGAASYNVYTPSLSTGNFVTVAPNASATTTLTVNRPEFALTPALGFMVVVHQNAGTSEALLKPYVPSP